MENFIVKLIESVVFALLFIWMSYTSQGIAVWIKSFFIKSRGFEKVSDEQWEKDFNSALNEYKNLIVIAENNNDGIPLPKRATKHAAGYDVFSPFEFTLNPGEEIKIPTGFKAYMEDDEKLSFYTRSGNGFKYVRLANQVGIGDSDYYECESNEGHYWVKLRNEGTKPFTAMVNSAIAQCIFTKVLFADNEEKAEETRVGGFGSTSK